MAEEDVNYASVVFKANKNPPPPAKKEEETVYDEVKVKNETTEQSPDGNATEKTIRGRNQRRHPPTPQVSAGFLQEKTGNSKQGHYQHLACCLGILCVILLLGIITVGIYITLANHTSEQSDLKANISALQDVNLNLTNANRNLSSENQKLWWEWQNVTVRFNTLNQSYTALESNLTDLTAENQELRMQRDNLTAQVEETKQQIEESKEQIEEWKKQVNKMAQQIEEWKEQNVSRVQWTIDQYCPRRYNVRTCRSCQPGWLTFQSSCYAIVNAKAADQLNWTEAQADCEERISELAVIFDEKDKDYISENSYPDKDIKGYWIGLRVVGGKWKWVDGSDLTESSWIQPPSPDEGHCAISVKNQGLKSVNCSDKNPWICKKKVLS